MRSIDLYINKLLSHSEKKCLIYKEQTFSYKDLYNYIYSSLKFLEDTRVEKGDLVIILGDYSIESISLLLALALNRNIIVPITSQNEAEVNERIEEAKPNWLINLRTQQNIQFTENDKQIRHDLVRNIIDKKSSGLLLFSSGSTGKPKAMIHDFDILVGAYLEKKAKGLNFLVFLMFDHIGGLNTLLNCLAMGSLITIPETRRPDHVFELIERYRVNVLPASPTFLNLAIISKAFERFNVSSLLLITYGTETMPEALLMRLKEMLPKVKFLQTFGTSETGIFKTSSKSSTSTLLRLEDDPDQEYKIVKGELWLRSKTQILGYINHNNDSFTSDGWFKTGDLVEQAEGGYFRIIGRSKEVINVGGEKVLPSEVESVLIELPFIVDCKVSGIPNAITGQTVVAEIVLQEGVDLNYVKVEIRKHCRKRLEAFKVPSKFTFALDIPHSDRFKKIRR